MKTAGWSDYFHVGIDNLVHSDYIIFLVVLLALLLFARTAFNMAKSTVKFILGCVVVFWLVCSISGISYDGAMNWLNDKVDNKIHSVFDGG